MIQNLVPVGFLTVWQCFDTDDDGRRMHRIGVTSTEAGAAIKIKGQGAYDGPGIVVKTPAVVIDGKFYLLESEEAVEVDTTYEDQRKLRESALAKCTPEERAALGYPPKGDA